MKNYYKILQIDEKADIEIIKKVYKFLVKNNHPDLFEGKEKEEAIILVQNLNEAYEVLSNEEKRKIYDKQLEEEKIKESDVLENLKRLEKENILLQEKLIEKENIIQKIFAELDMPYISNYTQSHFNANMQNADQNNVEEDVGKKYVEYMKETAFKILFLIIAFCIVLLLITNITKNNYFRLLMR